MADAPPAILRTGRSAAPAVLRLALGLVLLPHAAQKLPGWFGGSGITGTIEYMEEALGVPALLAFFAVVIEWVSSVALILGAATRVAAVLAGMEIAVAAAWVHAGNGFFMNWSGLQAGEGIEFHVLFVAIAVALAILGGGALSIDGWVAPARRPGQAPAPAPAPAAKPDEAGKK